MDKRGRNLGPAEGEGKARDQDAEEQRERPDCPVWRCLGVAVLSGRGHLPMAFITASPRWAGLSATMMPADFIASINSDF